MVQQQTFLTVLDNSGAKTVRCIQVLGGFRKRYAHLGDCIVVSVQQLKNKSKKTSKVKKKEVYQALIIKTKSKVWKKTGHTKTFTFNAVILLNKQKNPIGTRILTSIPSKLKKKTFQKIVNLSQGLI